MRAIWKATARCLLKGEEKPPKPEKPKKKPLTHDQIKELRSEVKKCEARVAKIEEMREKLATKLADPELYEDTRAGELDTWQKKYAEVMEGSTGPRRCGWRRRNGWNRPRRADVRTSPARCNSAGRSGGRRHRCRNRRHGGPSPSGVKTARLPAISAAVASIRPRRSVSPSLSRSIVTSAWSPGSSPAIGHGRGAQMVSRAPARHRPDGPA
jgi:hypothetical protein